MGEVNPNAAYNYAEEYDLVNRLMDAKEFEDAAHVYKQIEPTLKGSGDIHRWEDLTGKITSKPSYNVDPETQEHNLIRVKIHKAIKNFVNDIRSANAKLAEIEFAGKEKLSDVSVRDEVSSNMMAIINSSLDSSYSISNFKYHHNENIKEHYHVVSKNVYELIKDLEHLKENFMYYSSDETSFHQNLLNFYNTTEKILEIFDQY